MNWITFFTILNLFINVFLYFIMRNIKFEDLGKKTVEFTLNKIYIKRRWRHDIYLIKIKFENEVLSKAINEETYYNFIGEKKIDVYIRKFTSKIKPDFEKYAFSLKEIDWNKKDKEQALKFFIFSLLTFEALILMISFQL